MSILKTVFLLSVIFDSLILFGTFFGISSFNSHLVISFEILYISISSIFLYASCFFFIAK